MDIEDAIRDPVVLVDENDREIGIGSKLKCHLGKGRLHRAFSVFLFNSSGQLLLQKRSTKKTLWPLFWSNSVCSHPLPGEGYEKAASRRLVEEVGIEAEAQFLYKFVYSAKYKEIGAENEVCAVLAARSDLEPKPNHDEIIDYRWVERDELLKEVEENPKIYTPWFKMEAEELFRNRPQLLSEKGF